MEEQAQDPIHESFDKTLASITELIIATVRSAHANRFEEAKKLCDLAQSILQTKGRLTVAAKVQTAPVQAQAQENQAEGPAYEQRMVRAAAANYGHVNNNPHPIAVAGGNGLELVDTPDGGRAWVRAENQQHRYREPGALLFDAQGRLVNEHGVALTGPLDANSLMRHMLMAFGPNVQTGTEANRARVAADEAVELQALQNVIERAAPATREVLERRVRQLTSNMEIRSNAHQPPTRPQEVPVVPPDDSRGHPPDEGGAEGDDAPRLPAHAVGGGGNGRAEGQGAQHVVGADAVV